MEKCMSWEKLYEMSLKIKAKFPKGTRVEAISIQDVNGPPCGMRGSVTHVDDVGTVFVHWDDPKFVSGVIVVDGTDKIKKIRGVRK